MQMFRAVTGLFAARKAHKISALAGSGPALNGNITAQERAWQNVQGSSGIM